MANDALANEYEATIWSQPFSFPPGGTLTTATLTAAAKTVDVDFYQYEHYVSQRFD